MIIRAKQLRALQNIAPFADDPVPEYRFSRIAKRGASKKDE